MIISNIHNFVKFFVFLALVSSPNTTIVNGLLIRNNFLNNMDVKIHCNTFLAGLLQEKMDTAKEAKDVNQLTPSLESAPESYSQNVLIMLNSESMKFPMVQSLWSHFDYKLCADGGANRLYDGVSEDLRSIFLPDTIKGDLDSLRDDVSAYYRERGCRVVRDDDQDCNDLDKCMQDVMVRL